MTTRRPPIVVIMGHIDHGKTTLLDQIRQTRAATGELGGITQVVSTSEALVKDEAGAERRITLIDTPGHEAFDALRRRGATVADLAVLVVAADDGVKPQTLEAISTITEQKLPLIVAVNKIDKTDAKLEQIKQQLAEAGIMVEGYGGQVPLLGVSALTGQGVRELLDLILLTADLEELMADLTAPGQGYVLETHREAKRGVALIVLIKDGTLRVGEWLAVGGRVAKIKHLNDAAGKNQTSVAAGAPATVWGFTELPAPGSEVRAAADKITAEQIAQQQKTAPAASPRTLLGTEESPRGEVTLNVIIKADAAGAVEAVRRETEKLNSGNIRLEILDAAVGNITVNDLKLAGIKSGDLLVLGFRVKMDPGVKLYAEQRQINIVIFEIIYQLTDWLKAELARRQPIAAPVEPPGQAKILKIFKTERDKQIVGGLVTAGKLVDGKRFKIFRRQNLIGQGRIMGLEQQRTRSKEVAADEQFGALVEVRVPLAVGDTWELTEAETK